MATNRGTAFEHKFAENWKKSFPNTLCFKLPNQMSGYATINNLADFFCYDSKRLYIIDCKAHGGASFPFTAFPQYDRLIALKNIPNIITGVALWLYEKDKVYFIPTFTFEKAMKAGLKSINPSTINREEYYIVDIPSVKLRTFMNSDYTIMTTVPDYITYTQEEQS